MSVYFEISDNYVDRFGGKYWTAPIASPTNQLLEVSDRVWVEDSMTVRIVFSRHKSLKPPIKLDMKEFMWIKLQCKPVD